MYLRASLCVASLSLLMTSAHLGGRDAERVRANDNLRPAGNLRGGVLRLRLDARLGMWHPDGDRAPGTLVPAFAEGRRAVQIPGPLIRVPAGTEVVVGITNSVAGSTLTMYGLVSRPGPAAAPSDTVQVAAGASREVRFRLDAPGTYFYWGTTTGRTFAARTREDSQLSGAIVVDSAGAAPPRDRVFVIGMMSDTTPGEANRDADMRQLLMVINGRSWPNTERLAYAVGDTVRWRLVNASANVHPMHLHGFYFAVNSRGDGIGDTTYAEARRDRVVTERMLPAGTMSMTWIPERAGNWLFHCHFTSHFTLRDPLGMKRTAGSGAHVHHVANHAEEGMSGLVLGARVSPRRGAPATVSATEGPRRRLRLLVRRNAGGTDALPFYGFALHEGSGTEPPVDSGVHMGPPIVLTRGEPVAITVVNRLAEPTAVHWHGIELESYFDGVAGFSGSWVPGKGGGMRLSPVIAPSDSFEARFTPPRSGTFIYHTHVDEGRQQPAGLAGPLIVLDPGQRYDPSTDIPLLLSAASDPDVDAHTLLMNGQLTPDTLELRAGVTHRLRMINITTGRPSIRVQLRRDTSLVGWRVLAKDGADLPAARQLPRPALQLISIGETIDVEVTPDSGPLRIDVRTGRGVLLATMPVRVIGGGKAKGP